MIRKNVTAKELRDLLAPDPSRVPLLTEGNFQAPAHYLDDEHLEDPDALELDDNKPLDFNLENYDDSES